MHPEKQCINSFPRLFQSLQNIKLCKLGCNARQNVQKKNKRCTATRLACYLMRFAPFSPHLSFICHAKINTDIREDQHRYISVGKLNKTVPWLLASPHLGHRPVHNHTPPLWTLWPCADNPEAAQHIRDEATVEVGQSHPAMYCMR